MHMYRAWGGTFTKFKRNKISLNRLNPVQLDTEHMYPYEGDFSAAV